ncbi:MAG: hypothetical protein CL624_09665 [Arcobacter sp.]|nr:hypothetical protein [Arcobacter sp.]|tara:strand:+ start:4396 stop:4818 length:423 start_codon:yes stop_codon:yes gene_type:complete
MTEISAISTIFSSVKTATDIAKLIKDSTTSLEEAEIKLKMADLISALADIKIELSEVQVSQRDKEQIIQNLKEELNKKDKISFDGKIYWAENDETPFCTVCFEKDAKYHHLEYFPKVMYEGSVWSKENWTCKICENSYNV